MKTITIESLKVTCLSQKRVALLKDGQETLSKAYNNSDMGACFFHDNDDLPNNQLFVGLILRIREYVSLIFAYLDI